MTGSLQHLRDAVDCGGFVSDPLAVAPADQDGDVASWVDVGVKGAGRRFRAPDGIAAQVRVFVVDLCNL